MKHHALHLVWSVDAGAQVFYIDDTGTASVDFNVLNPNANTYTWDFGDGQLALHPGVPHMYTILPGSIML